MKNLPSWVNAVRDVPRSWFVAQPYKLTDTICYLESLTSSLRDFHEGNTHAGLVLHYNGDAQQK